MHHFRKSHTLLNRNFPQFPGSVWLRHQVKILSSSTTQRLSPRWVTDQITLILYIVDNVECCDTVQGFVMQSVVSKKTRLVFTFATKDTYIHPFEHYRRGEGGRVANFAASMRTPRYRLKGPWAILIIY